MGGARRRRRRRRRRRLRRVLLGRADEARQRRRGGAAAADERGDEARAYVRLRAPGGAPTGRGNETGVLCPRESDTDLRISAEVRTFDSFDAHRRRPRCELDSHVAVAAGAFRRLALALRDAHRRERASINRIELLADDILERAEADVLDIAERALAERDHDVLGEVRRVAERRRHLIEPLLLRRELDHDGLRLDHRRGGVLRRRAELARRLRLALELRHLRALDLSAHADELLRRHRYPLDLRADVVAAVDRRLRRHRVRPLVDNRDLHAVAALLAHFFCAYD